MIDLTKPVQTRDGKEVRIWMPNAGGDWPVHGSIYDALNDKWRLASWLPSGLHCGDDDCRNRLVNIPPKMIKRRLYISTWGDVGWRAWGDVGWKADTGPLIKSNFGGVNLTAFNFPVDIEIPEGYGL